MVKGLYTAYTGMINEQKRLDIVSNNLANAATVGYKEENVTNQAFDDVLTLKIKDASEAYVNRPVGKMSLGVKLGEVYTDFLQGSLKQTENTYDMAIEGSGLFTMSVTDKLGNESTKYTRDGAFIMTQDGYIVDKSGNHLQGESGDLQIPPDTLSVVIDKDGSIYGDGTFIDKVLIADFENYDYLQKQGDTMYKAVEGATIINSTSSIHQGYTEQSNVNVVSEMVEMITITRAYEANQKAIKSIDGMLELAVNSVGKV